MGGGAVRDERAADEDGRCDASDKLIDDEKQETRNKKRETRNSLLSHSTQSGVTRRNIRESFLLFLGAISAPPEVHYVSAFSHCQ